MSNIPFVYLSSRRILMTISLGGILNLYSNCELQYKQNKQQNEIKEEKNKKYLNSSFIYSANNPCEDRILIYDPCSSSSSSSLSNSSNLNENIKIYGVFDGHGGWQVSDYIKNNTLSVLLPKIQQNISIEEALKSSFDELEFNYRNSIKKSYQLGFGDVAKVGSCANISIITKNNNNNNNNNNTLTVANLGDCRTIIGTSLGSISTKNYENENENIDNEVITNVNGTLYTSYHVGRDHNARTLLEQYLLSSNHPNESNIVKCKNSHACYVKGRLQLTRAFGDLYLKSSEFNEDSDEMKKRGRYISQPYTPPYVLHTPDIQTITLNSNDRFIVMASDGVWDFMTPLEVVSFVAKHSNQNERDVAKLLVDEVLTRAANEASEHYNRVITLDDIKQIPLGKRRSFHDDTSVIVVYLD